MIASFVHFVANLRARPRRSLRRAYGDRTASWSRLCAVTRGGRSL
jgi:hypothetical protein